MKIIKTASGARYVVRERDGREVVTRVAAHAVLHRDGTSWGGQLAAEPLLDCTAPWPGQAWRFRTELGPFTTSPVVSVVSR